MLRLIPFTPVKFSCTSGKYISPIFRIFVLKRILTWWYHRKLRKNETQLAKLKKERSKILEDVMNTETYKVAKEILDKYGPAEQLKPREPIKVKLNIFS